MTAAGQALRRRIILAVILLAAFVVLLRVAVLAGEFDIIANNVNDLGISTRP
jgi:hypothetical protein